MASERFPCETQLISVIHDWAKGINFRSQTDVILLDFSKAFDSVPHERLVVKLDFHGIRGKMLNWIRAFLTNRKQKVSVNGFFHCQGLSYLELLRALSWVWCYFYYS